MGTASTGNTGKGPRPADQRPRALPRGRRWAGGGFTLVDLLVSIVVVAVLIGILLPSLAKVHEASHRIACASNLRQNGLALHMYANENDSLLPPSTYSDVNGSGEYWNTDPLFVRIDGRTRGRNAMFWDGLGHLYSQSYLSDGRVFYCPSHTGTNGYETYRARYGGEDGEIIANYQYRGLGPNGEERIDLINDTAALVSDGFREFTDINHNAGMNVLRAGMSVEWFPDDAQMMYNIAVTTDDGDDPNWDDGWEFLDRPPAQINGAWWN